MLHWLLLLLLCERSTLTHELHDVEMQKKKKHTKFYQIVFKWKIAQARWNINYRWISSDKEIYLEAFDEMKSIFFLLFTSRRVAIIIIVVAVFLPENIYRVHGFVVEGENRLVLFGWCLSYLALLLVADVNRIAFVNNIKMYASIIIRSLC